MVKTPLKQKLFTRFDDHTYVNYVKENNTFRKTLSEMYLSKQLDNKPLSKKQLNFCLKELMLDMFDSKSVFFNEFNEYGEEVFTLNELTKCTLKADCWKPNNNYFVNLYLVDDNDDVIAAAAEVHVYRPNIYTDANPNVKHNFGEIHWTSLIAALSPDNL